MKKIKASLKAVNSLKIQAFKIGKDGGVINIKSLPKYWTYGHYAEICVANIFGLIQDEIVRKGNKHKFYVRMGETLDMYGVDFRINGIEVQLKTKYSNQYRLSEPWDFYVEYDEPGFAIVNDILEYVDLNIEFSDRFKAKINHIWRLYMTDLGII